MAVTQPRLLPYQTERSGAAAPVYSTSPYGVAGAVAWYKADAETFQDTAFTTPATADAAPVGGWKDQTGLSHPVTQASSTARPTIRLNQKNSLPAVRFDGVNDEMLSLFTLPAPYHVFLVIKMITWVSNANCLTGGALDNFSVVQSGASPAIRIWNGTGLGTANSDLAVGAWGLMQILMAGTNQHYKVNAGTNTAVGGGAAAGGISVGGHNNLSAFSNVDVGELIVYNVALSDTDEATVRNGLNARWALF